MDYDGLAKKYGGAVSSQPPQSGRNIDYDALAAQHSGTALESAGGDIFDQAAATPQKDFSGRVGDRIRQNVNAPAHMLIGLNDAVKSAIKDPSSVFDKDASMKNLGNALGSVAGIPQRLYQEYRSDPANLVGDIITARAFKDVGGEGAATSAPNVAKPMAATAKTTAAKPGMMTNAIGVVSPKLANMIEAAESGKWQGLLPDRAVRLLNLFKSGDGGVPAPPALTPKPPAFTPGPQELRGLTPEAIQAQALRTGPTISPPEPSAGLGKIPVSKLSDLKPEPTQPIPVTRQSSIVGCR